MELDGIKLDLCGMTTMGVGDGIPEFRVVVILLTPRHIGNEFRLRFQQRLHLRLAFIVSLVDGLDDTAHRARENTDKLVGRKHG